MLIVLQLIVPKPINWSLSYMKKDKIPFGTEALYTALPEIFPGRQLLSGIFRFTILFMEKSIFIVIILSLTRNLHPTNLTHVNCLIL